MKKLLKKISAIILASSCVLTISFGLTPALNAEDTINYVPPLDTTENVSIEGTVMPIDAVTYSNIEAIPGGYIIKNIQIVCKGREFDSKLPAGIISQVKYITIDKYGSIDPDRHYRVLYDNRVMQVHIYSYKGVIENVRVIRL